ncbi:MAG: response regulator [Bryobacterales bacterium]|nr:response regulator [Bryobacterales bacterium]
MALARQARVLIVDDHDTNRLLLREHVAMNGCTPVLAADGLEALHEIHASPPDMVILDLMLPRVDGEAVLRKVRSNPVFDRMPIVVISALAERARVERCIDLGAADFIPKPFPPSALGDRLHHCLRSRTSADQGADPFRAREFAREMVSSLGLLHLATKGSAGGSSAAVLELLERFALETRCHLERTSAFCRVLTAQLSREPGFTAVIDEEFIENFSRSAPLHDIGKLAVPDSILSKPGALDPEEHRIMRRHVTVGAEILREIYRHFPNERLLEMAIDLALYHHERWDGLGYPYGLSGHAIPLVGRLMAIADVYDALRSARSYKPAFSHEKSRDIILEGSGTQFDPAIVAGFLACEHEFESLFKSDASGAEAERPHVRREYSIPSGVRMSAS